MYKGGVGVKGELSWESWWEEEQVCPKFCILMYYRILYWLVFYYLCSFTGAYPNIKRKDIGDYFEPEIFHVSIWHCVQARSH